MVAHRKKFHQFTMSICESEPSAATASTYDWVDDDDNMSADDRVGG